MLGRLVVVQGFVFAVTVATQATVSFEAPNSGFSTSVGGTAVQSSADVHETFVDIDVFAPILIHPAAHFFLGLGPEMFRDISHSVDSVSNKRTFYGVSSVVGGWL